MSEKYVPSENEVDLEIINIVTKNPSLLENILVPGVKKVFDVAIRNVAERAARKS